MPRRRDQWESWPMNRAQRRRAERASAARGIRQLQHKVDSTNLPGVIRGLTDACIDCRADGELVLLPGGDAVGRIFHDDGCPAAAGITEWKPVP
jgi:hypothetical protein